MTHSGVLERRKTRWLVLSVIVLIYLICCFSLALTRAPWSNPAFGWITTGHPGVSALDDSGPFLPFAKRINVLGIREHIYMDMPLHTVFLAT